MSFEALNWVIGIKVGNPGAKHVLFLLANYADENNQAFPSREHLAKVTEIAVRTVSRHIEFLETHGFIERIERRTDEGKFFSNIYELAMCQIGTRDHVPNRPAAKLAHYTKECYKEDSKTSIINRVVTAKRGTRIPDPFVLTKDMQKYAVRRRPDLDVRLETEKFVNHWRSKAGKDGTKLDWQAAWRNWILGAWNKNSNNNQRPAWLDVGTYEPANDVQEPCSICGNGDCLDPHFDKV